MKRSLLSSKYILLTGLSVLLLNCSAKQKPDDEQISGPPISATAKSTYTFTGVPKKVSESLEKIRQILLDEGYAILDTASGDLNMDAYPDRIMILKKNGEDTISGSPRPLLIITTQSDHSYKIEARNDSVVLCHNCGGVFGDPYEHIVIKNGYFSIEHYGGSNWRWTRVITFKYHKDKNNWVLHRDAGVSFHTSVPDKQENIVNNKQDFDKLPFEKFNYEKGQ